MPQKTIAFLDTNYFLHFPAFDTVDWKKLLTADDVELVVTSVVFYELEKHKDTSKKDGMRKRALGAVTKFEQLRAEQSGGAQIDGGVTLRVTLDSAPPEGFTNDVLAKEVADDRIVHAMIALSKSRPTERVIVYTSDRALRMKARSHGFDAVEPDPINRIVDVAEET